GKWGSILLEPALEQGLVHPFASLLVSCQRLNIRRPVLELRRVEVAHARHRSVEDVRRARYQNSARVFLRRRALCHKRAQIHQILLQTVRQLRLFFRRSTQFRNEWFHDLLHVGGMTYLEQLQCGGPSGAVLGRSTIRKEKIGRREIRQLLGFFQLSI
ncbi:hypothetical protein PFISCL1PPCAC_109, partial [Pristionchus fissidentatus]